MAKDRRDILGFWRARDETSSKHSFITWVPMYVEHVCDSYTMVKLYYLVFIFCYTSLIKCHCDYETPRPHEMRIIVNQFIYCWCSFTVWYLYFDLVKWQFHGMITVLKRNKHRSTSNINRDLCIQRFETSLAYQLLAVSHRDVYWY